MIYRALIDRADLEDFLDRLVPTTASAEELARHLKAAALSGRRLQGASYSALAAVMDRHGLRRPTIGNPRARFYFTEAGWAEVGRHVAAEAKRLGHVVKVIRRKRPSPSQIFYPDELQIAILPGRGALRRCAP